MIFYCPGTVSKYKIQWQWQLDLENTFKEQSLRIVTIAWIENITKTMTMTNREHHQIAILEKLCNFWHFWKLRTSKHYNHSGLTIKSDTGQHSQFLRCLCFSYSFCCNWLTYFEQNCCCRWWVDSSLLSLPFSWDARYQL